MVNNNGFTQLPSYKRYCKTYHYNIPSNHFYNYPIIKEMQDRLRSIYHTKIN